LGSGRYVDVVDNQVVIKTRSSSRTQKWYFDFKTRTIMNAGTQKSLSISQSGRGKRLNVWSTTSDWWQIWRFSQEMFINAKGLVFQIDGKKDAEGATCGVGINLYDTNQIFTITYTEKEVAIKTDGVNAEFGFHINRPFYIVTKMGSGRAVEVVGGRNVVLRMKKYNSIS
jgi:hypothetical protein